MTITENFALLSILRAIEKLSAVPDGKTDAESAEDKREASAADAGPPERRAAKNDFYFAENLLTRHERAVNRIRNGKK